jgi:methyltransferase
VSLGPYWTTRIVTLPGAPLVQRGPYRFLNHPNYAVVTAEIAALPLAFGAYAIAITFSLANLALLAWRVRIEDRALAARRGIAAPPVG